MIGAGRRRSVWICCLLVLSLAGCGGGSREDPILRLSAQEAYEEGQRLLADKKYGRAREYFAHAFQVEPNSAVGRESLLLAADAHYLAGGADNYIRAEARYRDFQNRFPTSDRSPYVQYQIANSLEKRILRPDRDQTATRQALAAYEDLVRVYPTSEYAVEGQREIRELRDHLAEHEFVVGHFQFRRGLNIAAAARFSNLIEEYPDFGAIDRVLYFRGRTYRRMGLTEEARNDFERLRSEFPDSDYVQKIPKEGAS